MSTPIPQVQQNPTRDFPLVGDRFRKSVSGWKIAHFALWQRLRGLLRFVYALRSEGHSFVGHMQTLLGKKHWGVDLGPLLERSNCGQLQRNGRTDARSYGTQALVSRYPWASSIDLQVFLDGFDMGERYALGTLDIPEQEPFSIGSFSTSLQVTNDDGKTLVGISGAIAGAQGLVAGPTVGIAPRYGGVTGADLQIKHIQ